MSSKAVGQQQQGRRTPLSLAGGKNSHQQQNQSNANKTNNNAAKNQEPKDSTTNNKNNNQAAKNQQEPKDLPSTQKDTKKTQQNGNKHVTADDDVILIEQNGTANGASSNGNNGVPNKSNAKLGNQAGNKDNKEKETDKEPQAVNEKPEPKSKKGDAPKAAEKKQTEVNEKPATPTASPSTSNKSKDRASTPTLNTTANEKKQNAQSVTPVKANTSGSASRKSITPSKPENTEKSPVAAATKNTTTSKSPKSAGSVVIGPVAEITPEELESNDNDIEPLVVESISPPKRSPRKAIAPAATSTPGKAVGGKRGNTAKSGIHLPLDGSKSVDRKSVPRTYSDISGRRSIRSVEYTPSMYNAEYRESYRRINTELDVSANINNTSMNVTVGSEIPNNSSFLSFSLFGRGRKRERTPPPTVPYKSQSTTELTAETSPPKRARLEGIFCAMSSPLTMLRTRFSKAALETPAKGQEPEIADDVHNVSGVSIEEDVCSAENTATEDITVGTEAIAEKTPSKTTPLKGEKSGDAKELQDVDDAETDAMDVDSDIKIPETHIIPAVGEPKAKQRGCLIM